MHTPGTAVYLVESKYVLVSEQHDVHKTTISKLSFSEADNLRGVAATNGKKLFELCADRCLFKKRMVVYLRYSLVGGV